MKFADILETSEGLRRKSLKVAHDAINLKPGMSGLFSNENLHSNFWSPKRFLKVLFHD